MTAVVTAWASMLLGLVGIGAVLVTALKFVRAAGGGLR